jgi:hypothetical protein
MDEFIRNIHGGMSWCMLFIDDVVLLDESRTGLTRSFNHEDELWTGVD